MVSLAMITAVLCMLIFRLADAALPVEYYDGRTDETLHGNPSPRCCYGVDCLVSAPSQKVAVATLLRNDGYIPLLEVRSGSKQLDVSIRHRYICSRRNLYARYPRLIQDCKSLS